MTMAAGEGSTDAENGVKMASRDRYRRVSAGQAAGPGPGPAAAPDAGADDDAGPRGAPEEQAAREEQGLEVYGDSAYGSGHARADYREARHHTLIKPGPPRPPVPARITLAAVTI